MKLTRVLAAAAAIVVSQSALADIKVGVSTSLTGPGASIGLPARNAVALWPTEMGGEKIIITLLDDGGEPTAATKNAMRFIEEKYDVILGAANTPSTIAIAQAANENKILQLSPAPAELPKGKDYWTFRAAMHAKYYTEGLLEHMKNNGVKTLGFLGLSDAYGESSLQAFKELAEGAGIKLVAIERFARADNSVTGQALNVISAKPDAIIVAAVGGGAALPQKALKERGYKGKIYHTAASVSPDFLRLAGKDADGALVSSGPEVIAEQLPDNHSAKQRAMEFVKRYEDKYGAGTRTQFAAHAYDLGLVLEKAIPVALKKAKPGTPEFRVALRDAVENYGEIATTKGTLKYTPDDHWGFGPDARVIVTPQGGAWKLIN